MVKRENYTEGLRDKQTDIHTMIKKKKNTLGSSVASANS